MRLALLISLVLTLALPQENAPLTLVGKGREADDGVVSAVQVEGNLAILTAGNDVILYDMAVPKSPKRTGRYTATPAADAKSSESTMIVAAARRRAVLSLPGQSVQFIDFANAAKPKLLAQLPPRGTVRSALYGTTFAALGYGALEPTPSGAIDLIDVTVGENPRPITTVDVGAPVIRMFRRGSLIVAAHPDGALSIIDARDATRAAVVGKMPGNPAPNLGTPYLTISGDGSVIYMTRADLQARDHATLTVVDLRIARSPMEIAHIDFPISGSLETPVVVQGTRVMILAGSSGGVVTVDARDSNKPVLANTRTLPAGVQGLGLGLDDIHLLVAAGNEGVLIFQQPQAKR